MLTRIKNIPQHRLTMLSLVLYWGIFCAGESVCQESPLWANGEPLPLNARRHVSAMTVKSQPFLMGHNMIGLSDSGLEVSLTQLQEQFKGIRVEDNQMQFRIVFDSDILFDFDKSSIRSDAVASLQAVAGILKQHKDKTIRIVGHTDSKGSDSYNQTLSSKRAESVKAWLSARSERGEFRFEAIGRGEREPIAPNTMPDGSDNPSGRQQNRRVEIEIPKQAPR